MSGLQEADQAFSGSGGDVRSRLVAAAEGLFLRDGLVSTSVDAIVATAKTSKRDFYKHFADRQAIFLEVVQRSLLAPDKQMDAVRQGAELDSRKRMPGSEDLHQFLCKSAHFIYDKHLDAHSLGLFRATLEASMHYPELSAAVYQTRSRTFLASYLDTHKADQGFSFDNAYFASIRFGHLATDGLKFMMGAEALLEDQRTELAHQVASLFLEGHAAPKVRADQAFLCPAADFRAPARACDRHIIDMSADTRLSPEAWEAVLDIAWAEFGKRGYADTSLGVIAKQTGVSRNTLYRQFACKENLFIASAGRVIDRVYRGHHVLGGQGVPLRHALIELALQLSQRFLMPDSLALHRHLLIEAGRNAGMTTRIYDYLTKTALEGLSPIFDRLADEGALRQDVKAGAPWRFFVLATFGTRFIFVPPAPAEQRALATEAVDLFLYGCRRT